MASFEQHARDCQRFLGNRCEPLNLWIDEFFRSHGPSHRKFRHHWEGIREAGEKFGDLGYYAAIVHILRDCRNIPRCEDYESGNVDALGLLKNWPVTAYIKYADRDFETLVMNNLLGSSGTVLWAFINEGALNQFLSGVSRLTPPEVEQLSPKHAVAREAAARLHPRESASFPQKTLTPKIGEHFEALLHTPVMTQVRQLFPLASITYVRVQDLISPLVYIDHEYVEELRPELAGLDDYDVARFALPEAANLPVRAAVDPTQHNVNFISSNKTLTVGPVQLVHVGGGVEVRFFVGANLSAITVSRFQGRLILRNGIHRAYLLAKLGVSEVPCIFSPDDTPPNLFISAYPSFIPQTLLQPRPPMLVDYLDDELCLQVPLQRTRRVIRISAEEAILPID